MDFELNENQLKNLLTFLNRVDCKGVEAVALTELFNIFGKNNTIPSNVNKTKMEINK